jgi:Fe-S-cluster containining protein
MSTISFNCHCRGESMTESQQQSPERDVPNSDGRLHVCHSMNCNYRCCQFQQSNYIVLYPGELEEARKDGKSFTHLQIIQDDDHGGKRAVCKANDTSSCDDGYKPLDCRCYPFFPIINDGRVGAFIKGRKCPLLTQHLVEHAQWVEFVWNRLLARSLTMRRWLGAVKQVGYTYVDNIKPCNRAVD